MAEQLALELKQPTIQGILVVHSIAGRHRYRVCGLRQNADAEARITSALEAVPGICGVRVNVWSGTVVVAFDANFDAASIPALIQSSLDSSIPAPARQCTPPQKTSSKIREWLRGFLGKRSEEPTSAALPSDATPWHALSTEQSYRLVRSGPRGLTRAEAEERVTAFGQNALPVPQARSIIKLFLDQLGSVPVLLLLGSSAVSFLTGGVIDGLVILTVVILNASIGAFTERGAERTISTLTRLEEPEALVLRDGRVERIDASQVALGEVVLLSRGSYIPADARLIEARNLTVAESALTGESAPVEKFSLPLPASAPLAERANMVYRGTIVTGGSGMGLVVGTGVHTEIGAVHQLMNQAFRPETPMEGRLNQLGFQTALGALGVCGLTIIIGAARGFAWIDVFRSAVSLAVAALPEGLPTMATTALAFGMVRMRRHGVLARNLGSVETIGAIDLLCLDKTGTLTMNSMSVTEVYAGSETISMETRRSLLRPGKEGRASHLEMLLAVCALCSEATVDAGSPGESPSFGGSATETALLELVESSHLRVAELRRRFPTLDVRPRTEDRHLMVTVHRTPRDTQLIAAKGSPEQMLSRCVRRADASGVHSLTNADRKRILHENERLASGGRRVLGFAYAEAPLTSAQCDGASPAAAAAGKAADAPSDWIWLGLIALADPPRDGVIDALRDFHRAGIGTRMVTGDQRTTASAIGREIGLWEHANEPEVWDANRDGALDPAALDSDIFSRVSPSRKLEIVQALQQAGHIVAMTGDGINDGPALKAADVGIALGVESTETARESADLILRNDDMRALLAAVREGRAVQRNIRQAVRFLVATNLSEVLGVLGAVAVGIGQPLTPRQLLWLNLVTDIFPVLALAVQPANAGAMEQPPPDPGSPLVSRREFPKLVVESALIASAVGTSYVYGLRRYGSGAHASTLAFLSLTTAQLIHTLTVGGRPGFSTQGKRSEGNPYIPLAVAGGVALELITMLPPFRSVLGLTALSGMDIGVALAAVGVSSLATLAVQLLWKVPEPHPALPPPRRTLGLLPMPAAPPSPVPEVAM